MCTIILLNPPKYAPYRFQMLHQVTVHNIELSDCPKVCQSQVNDEGYLLTQ
jgi:hypothetical protein